MRLVIMLLLSFVLVTAINLGLKKNSKFIDKKIGWQHYFWGYIFILYLMIALTEVVGFPSWSGFMRLSKYNESIFNANINLVPFQDGFEISGLLNIIFFIPLGFVLPTLWSKYNSLIRTLCFGVIFSFIIEIGQLFVKYRITDIDDLLMNGLGVIVGWIIYKIWRKICNNRPQKSLIEYSSNDSLIFKLEPYMYIIIAILCTLFS